MDFVAVAVVWVIIGFTGGIYRRDKKRDLGLAPSKEGEWLILVWDALWGPLTWFSMFRP
jgi:hypothetical protein